MRKEIIVLGAGIVGVSTALALQLSGHQVQLLDRKLPGRETSFGNAGVLSDSSVYVFNNPGLLRALPGLIANRSNSLRYDLGFVMRRLGWMLKFLSNCRKKQVMRSARAIRALLKLSLNEHKKWISAAGATDLLRVGGGWLKLFRTEAGFARYEEEMRCMTDVGVNFTVYEKEEIRQLEPALNPIFIRAVLMDDTCSISNPAGLTDAYVSLFSANGGIVSLDSVNGLSDRKGDGWCVTGEKKKYFGDHVVISAGAWSAEIASWLGYDIPMAWERGYHSHIEPVASMRLNRPILDMEGGFSIAPMGEGMRVTSGVEITARDAPPNYDQIKRVVKLAKQALPLGEEKTIKPWMGRRPTLVDSLPMIGCAPRHKALWFNFGHQHIGLSMGPGSGILIRALIDGIIPPIAAEPFRPSRFII